MTTQAEGPQGPEPSEEELRAAYEAEIKRVRIEHVLLENVVTMVNLGMRRTGLAPGTEDERDPEQVRLAIESVRALLPLVEQVAQPQAGPIRDALSQLQMAFVRIGGQPAGAGEAGAPAPDAPPASGPGGAPPGPSPGAASPPEGPGAAPPPPSRGAQPDPGTGQRPAGGEPGPAQRSGRLWIPGQ